MGKNERLIKTSVLYIIGSFSTKIISFLFIPLYTTKLSPADYGYFDLIIASISILVPLGYQGIWESVLRFGIFDKDGKSIVDQGKVIATSIIYCSFLSLFYLIIFIIIGETLDIRLYLIAIFVGLSNMLQSLWQYSARAKEENRAYVVGSLISSLVIVTCNFVFIALLNLNIEALLISTFLGNIVNIFYLEHKISLIKLTVYNKFDFQLVKPLLKYSFPLMLNSVSLWILNMSNRFIVTIQLGFDSNGILAIANRFPVVLATFFSLFNMAWQEEAFRQHNAEDKEEYWNYVLNSTIKILLTIIIVAIPLTNIVFEFLVKGEYQDGVVLVPLLFLAAALAQISSQFGTIFLVQNNSKIVLISTIAGSLVTVFATWISTFYINLYAVPLGMLIGTITILVIRIKLIRLKNIYLQNKKLLSILTFWLFIVLFIFYSGNQLGNYIIAVISIIIFIWVNKNIIIKITYQFKNFFK